MGDKNDIRMPDIIKGYMICCAVTGILTAVLTPPAGLIWAVLPVTAAMKCDKDMEEQQGRRVLRMGQTVCAVVIAAVLICSVLKYVLHLYSF